MPSSAERLRFAGEACGLPEHHVARPGLVPFGSAPVSPDEEVVEAIAVHIPAALTERPEKSPAATPRTKAVGAIEGGEVELAVKPVAFPKTT